MKKIMAYVMALAMFAGLCTIAWANDETQKSKIDLSGFGYVMFGQLVKGEAQEYDDYLTHYWMNSALVHLCATSDANEWFTTNLALEMQMEPPFKGANDMAKASYYMEYKMFIPTAEGIFHWDFKDHIISSLKIESGLFQYTFNSAVKNLGNYLYRGYAKPLFLQTRIDYPWADLMGMRAELGMFGNKLKLEGLFTSEINYVPWFDWSPGFTVSYAPNKIIDVGAGITFPHMIQAFGGWLADEQGKQWKATKVDARAIFDPKPLLGDLATKMGVEDGKIYGEAAILGLKDSAEYTYIPANTLLHRMPFLLGINVPAFKMLDYISVELEWFRSPYPNDWYGSYNSQSPISVDVSGRVGGIDNYINKDNFKWSVYSKKSIGKFEVKAIMANDHTIYKLFQKDYLVSEQTMKKPDEWHWYLELRYNL